MNLLFNCCIINARLFYSPDWIKKKSKENCQKYKKLNHLQINIIATKYPSKTNGWKTIEKNNPKTARNILYIKEKYPAYISKYCLLMIPNTENKGWHYLSVRK